MARIAPGSAGWKPFSRVVTDDQSVLCWVKWNPRRIYAIDGSTVVTAARMQVQVSQVNFDINAVADTTIGTYTGNTGGDDAVMLVDAATVQGLLDRINGLELAIDRYIAGLGDFRPQHVIGTGDGLAVALANILLGVHSKGLQVFADTSGLAINSLFAVGVGTGGCRPGAGASIPDLAAAEYTSTVAGVVTEVRAPKRSAESYPFQQTFESKITGITFAAAYASNAKIVSIYDVNDNLLFQEDIGSTNVLTDASRYGFDNPVAQAVGPLFVECTGTGALTDGALKVQGFTRVS